MSNTLSPETLAMLRARGIVPSAGGFAPAQSGLPAAPPRPVPGTYQVPPGWSPAPVQADNKVPYVPPPGWHVPGQPATPPPTAGQQDAPNNYQPPPGWTAEGQPAAAAPPQAVAQNDKDPNRHLNEWSKF